MGCTGSEVGNRLARPGCLYSSMKPVWVMAQIVAQPSRPRASMSPLRRSELWYPLAFELAGRKYELPQLWVQPSGRRASRTSREVDGLRASWVRILSVVGPRRIGCPFHGGGTILPTMIKLYHPREPVAPAGLAVQHNLRISGAQDTGSSGQTPPLGPPGYPIRAPGRGPPLYPPGPWGQPPRPRCVGLRGTRPTW